MGVESREARDRRLRAWWAGLSHEQRAAEVRAGHVRMNFPEPPAKHRRKKRTREAQERSRKVAEMREKHGECFVHLPPLARFGVELKATLAQAGR